MAISVLIIIPSSEGDESQAVRQKVTLSDLSIRNSAYFLEAS
jgi:hypothetical protein